MSKKKPAYMMTKQVVNFLENTDALAFHILEQAPKKETMTVREVLILCNKQYTDYGKRKGFGKDLFRKLQTEVITYIPFL